MLGWFRALMPKDDRFFDLFARHSRTLVQGAVALEKLLQAGDAYFFRLNCTVGFYNTGSTAAHILAVRSLYPFGK